MCFLSVCENRKGRSGLAHGLGTQGVLKQCLLVEGCKTASRSPFSHLRVKVPLGKGAQGHPDSLRVQCGGGHRKLSRGFRPQPWLCPFPAV